MCHTNRVAATSPLGGYYSGQITRFESPASAFLFECRFRFSVPVLIHTTNTTLRDLTKAGGLKAGDVFLTRTGDTRRVKIVYVEPEINITRRTTRLK